MIHWMFSCKEISHKVSQSMDIRLPLYQRLAINMHLLMCRYCARFSRQLKMLRQMSRYDDSASMPPELPGGLSPDARERIKSVLRTST
jgi:hypothetical protein